jgi:hypothetical protein
MHCSTGRAEGYNDLAWNCNPVPPDTFVNSIMGCGPQHALEYTARDDWDWYIWHVPPPIEQTNVIRAPNGQVSVRYCNTAVNADRVFVYYDRGEGLIWSGERLSIASGTCRDVEVYHSWCYWIKQTNQTSDFLYATEVKVGCT